MDQFPQQLVFLRRPGPLLLVVSGGHLGEGTVVVPASGRTGSTILSIHHSATSSVARVRRAGLHRRAGVACMQRPRPRPCRASARLGAAIHAAGNLTVATQALGAACSRARQSPGSTLQKRPHLHARLLPDACPTGSLCDVCAAAGCAPPGPRLFSMRSDAYAVPGSLFRL
jgi:hypothetical protein